MGMKNLFTSAIGKISITCSGKAVDQR